MLLSTTEELQGFTVTDYLGLVHGEVVSGANILRDVMATVTDFVGGRSAAYEEELVHSREAVIREVSDRAQRMGADGVVGLSITALFVLIYYRTAGLVALFGLVVNTLMIFGGMAMFDFTFTLPSIAGMILSIGMAVDANVLIYERIREELRLGVSPQAAIKAGFEKAFSAILDSNVTTLIAGLVLYVLGKGPIQNFAVVLVLGIATSMFTALMGSRALLTLMYGGKRKLTRLPI